MYIVLENNAEDNEQKSSMSPHLDEEKKCEEQIFQKVSISTRKNLLMMVALV